MKLTQQIAKHLREIHFGGNWTASNLKDALTDVTWKEATTQIEDFNTIAVLTFHVTYYLPPIIDVLEGKPLTAKDELSFLCPEITSESQWQDMQNKAWETAEKAATLIEQLSDEQMGLSFSDDKYGSYFRNLEGAIEHMHYHLGQIVILKRLIKNNHGK